MLRERAMSEVGMLRKEYDLKLELLTNDFDQIIKENHRLKRDVQTYNLIQD